MAAGGVLLLVSTEKHTGPGRVALHHARLLRETGRTVHFRARAGGTLEEHARAAELWPETAARETIVGRAWSLPRDVRRIRRLLRQLAPAAILVYRSPEHIAATLAARRRLPLVRYLHDAERLEGTRLAARALGNLLRHPSTRALLTPDPTRTERLQRLLGNDRPVRFAPGGVDTIHFVPDRGGTALRAELGIDDAAVVAGLVARAKPGRGHGVFLEALRLALREAPALRGLCVGGGELAETLRARARDLGIGEAVCLFHSDTRFEEALGAIDIGVLLDPGSAGTGQAALELMSMARPVVVRARGVLGTLAGGDDAVRILPETPDAETEAAALAGALVALVRDPTERLRMGQAARDRVEQSFSRAALQRTLTDLLAAIGAQ